MRISKYPVLGLVWCGNMMEWTQSISQHSAAQTRTLPTVGSSNGETTTAAHSSSTYCLQYSDSFWYWYKLGGETRSCISVPASVQSMSGQSFMIEILRRCQHNNTTTNVHFNGSLRRIKFFILSSSLNELPAPTCLWTLGWCRLQIALLFCLCNCLIDLRWSIFQVYWQIWIVTTIHCLLSSKRRAMARRVTMAGSQESHHAKSKWWIPPQFIQVFWSPLCVLYSLFISQTKM